MGLTLGEPALALGDLAQGADLPRHVADPRRALALGRARSGEGPLWEQHDGMMVGADPQEIAVAVPARRVRDLELRGEIDRVGLRQAEQVAVEMQRLLLVLDIEAEMAEPQHLERPLEPHAADIVALLRGCHRILPCPLPDHTVAARACAASIDGSRAGSPRAMPHSVPMPSTRA